MENSRIGSASHHSGAANVIRHVKVTATKAARNQSTIRDFRLIANRDRPMPSPTHRRGQSVEEWASRTLLHAHAIAHCPEHGYMRLKFSHSSIEYARALASQEPFPKLGRAKSVAALDHFLDGLSDDCPACG